MVSHLHYCVTFLKCLSNVSSICMHVQNLDSFYTNTSLFQEVSHDRHLDRDASRNTGYKP